MAKVTPQHTLDPLPVAGKEVHWGLTQETLCLGAASSQPQVSCKCLPEGVERWPSPVHAWMGERLTRSCSWALVTPLTTKQYHSASENKICIYVTSPPPQPSPPVIPGVYVTDTERSNSSGLLVTSEHQLGYNHSACPWENQRRGRGRSGVGGVGSRPHTQPHFEAWLFKKGCSGTPWHSAGHPGLCHTAGHTQTWEGRARCPR